MRRSGLERRLVDGVLLLFLIPTLVAGAVLLVLYGRGVLDRPGVLALTVLVVFVTMMAYLGTVAHAIGRPVVRALQEIRRGTELMATVNPDHRLAVRTGDEIESVADGINHMADRVRDARAGLEAEVARATRELAVEHGKLSGILGALDEGVVVATLEGRVMLANPRAHELLGAPVGFLGQSLFTVMDREALGLYLERLREGHGEPRRLTLHAASGAVLQAGMTGLVDPAGTVTGFILALRDVSRPARDEVEHRRLLADTLHELRGPLASIRSLSESLAAEPALLTEAGRPLIQAIHTEAVRVADVLRTRGAHLGLERLPWHFEALELADLVVMTLHRLGPDAAEVSAPDVGAMEQGRLRAEASALSAALAHLLRRVLARRRPGGRVWLGASQRGAVVQIEAGAEGAESASRLETELETPVLIGPELELAAREVLRRHGGEAWAWSEGERMGFRVTLVLHDVEEPASTSSTRFAGAGTASGYDGTQTAAPRPDLYDFSFLDRAARALAPEQRERALAELDFVVVDTETTGLRREEGHRIVSLAGVRVRGGVVKRGEFFDALVSPGRPIPESSTRFHGITDGMVADAPPIDVVLPAFVRFAAGAGLVGHEIWFDLRFLGPETDRLGLARLETAHAVLDTRLLSAAIHDDAADHDLDAVAARLGVSIRGRHSALGDALATAEVFTRLLALARHRGVATLGGMLDLSRRVRGGAGPDGAPR